MPRFLEVRDPLVSFPPQKITTLKHDDAKLEGTELIYNGAMQEQSFGSIQITEL